MPHDLRSNLDGAMALASALLSAAETGLLDHLATAPDPDPATSLGLHPEGTELVLQLLEAGGWVEHGPRGWNAPKVPVPTGPITAARMARVFDATGPYLRTGQSASRHPYDPAGVANLADWFAPSARALAAAIPPAGGRILDVGAGSAMWSLSMVSDPADRVLALDEAHVLPASRARAEQLGLSDRLDCHASSLWDADFDALPSRRVVCANVLHLFRPAEAREVVHRMARAVEPGGSLVLIDAMFDRPDAQLTRRAYALHLRLRQPDGTVYDAEQLSEWAAEAGLTATEVVELPIPRGLGAVVARASA